MKNKLKKLEEQGVFIHFIPEHYDDGTNYNFSIEFTKEKFQTGWYNDNHEFGDVARTIECAIKISEFMLWKYLQNNCNFVKQRCIYIKDENNSQIIQV